MADQKHSSPEPEPGIPPGPEPAQPIAIADMSPRLEDPRQIRPTPVDPLNGIERHLELEPLPGPTEASEAGSDPLEPEE